MVDVEIKYYSQMLSVFIKFQNIENVLTLIFFSAMLFFLERRCTFIEFQFVHYIIDLSSMV